MEFDHLSHITIPFYFIRHGETAWNRQGIIMGQQDIPLNECGVKQAYEAQSFLKNMAIDAMYTSSLKRAHQTALILNEALDRPLHKTDQLWERGWGEGEGKPHSHFMSGLKDSDIPQGAEPWKIFENRMLSALHHIMTESKKSPLIIAHGGFFMAMTRLMGYSHLHAENCVPYLFRPPERKDQLWFICELGKEN